MVQRGVWVLIVAITAMLALDISVRIFWKGGFAET